jgi:hypothetical protein
MPAFPSALFEIGFTIRKTRGCFDRWLEGNAFRSARSVEVDQIVDEVMNDLKATI